MKTDLPTILVTGADGQLGKEFRVIADEFPSFNFLFVSRSVLAIDDFTAVKNYFATHTINICINCAAYTAVDKAETEIEKAFLVNATAAGNLAAICKEFNTRFIHISTDYVFDGTATQPIKEDHPTLALGVYGASKLKGEALVMQYNPNAIIIRTSWVYSSFGNNFVKTMLRLMLEKESINVVNDQWGSPTYAADLASAIMQLINNWEMNEPLQYKIFNYANQGITTWYNFALAIQQLTGAECRVNPIPSIQYPTPAKRPAYAVLDNTRIREVYNITIPAWEESLQKCLQILSSQVSTQ